MNNKKLPTVILALLLAGCAASSSTPPSTANSAGSATPQAQTGLQAPEVDSGYTEKPGWKADKFMVAAANPLATDAGYRILKKGGAAIDAAIATQMVLNLVEPQSSGIGGGAFMLYFDGDTVSAFDGRETAPMTATEKLFQSPDGRAMNFYDGVVGGRSVGTPGVLRMLELAHRKYGKLHWAELFEPAIALAENGFAVSPRLHKLLVSEHYLQGDPVARAYFYDDRGNPWPVGHILKNPELARVLREIAQGGADAFYNGHIAHDIETKVHAHPTNPGFLTAADMAAYEAKIRVPICTDYKQWTVCGAPPPSSGGIAIAQMLGILAHTDIDAHPPKDGQYDAQAVHLFTEAGRLAYADRNHYVADPDFVPLPGNSNKPLVDPQYLAGRAELIGDKSMGHAHWGVPNALHVTWGDDTSPELPSTSHVSIVDAYGGALTMTTTIEDQFGSRQMVDGFLLNNQLTDFSFDYVDADGPVANRVQPGKRPRTSMSPTMVFERGTHKLVLETGSPGGSAIINYVAKTVVGVLDWNLNVQQAISLPNLGSRNGPTELEKGRVSDDLIAQLRAKGHNVQVMEQTSGLQGIMRTRIDGKEVWFGGADPRREGIVEGD